MTENQPQSRPPRPVRKTATRAATASVGLIWVVPVLALLVTLGLAWNSYTSRGETIEIAFSDATGIVPGETNLRFREIVVGQVEAVRFTDDLSQVVVEVEVDKEVAQFIDSDAYFWIVRPEVSAQGVTRLDTVLSGAFIEGYWDSKITGKANRFVGLDRPPLVAGGAEGTWVELTIDNADGISDGAPILYRGVQVGQMQNPRLSESGEYVVIDGFIEAPHDKRLTSSTVFWDTSGFSLSLGARGVSFNVNSLSSLLQGGVTFDTLVSGGEPIESGHNYPIMANEDTARQSLFAEDRSGQLKIDILVDSAVSGLEKGADVQFVGLRVGEVTDISVLATEGESTTEILQKVSLSISPRRLGLSEGATPEDALAFLTSAVQSGLRARVGSAGFFGNSLIVEMVNVPDSPPAQMQLDAEPNPIMPAIEADLSDFTGTAEGFISRIGELPIEEVLKSATDMMNSITALASSQDTRAIPESLRKTIDEAQTTLADIRSMVEALNEADVTENAAAAMLSASRFAERLSAAMEPLPGIMAALDSSATSISNVDFTALSSEMEATLKDLRNVIGTEAAAGLPVKLGALMDTADSAIKKIDQLAADVELSGAGKNLGPMLKEATEAFDAVKLAAADVPAMVDEMDAVAAKANEIDFAGISAQVDGILTDLRTMLGTEDAEALPRNLSATLEAASGLMNDLRDGNAAGSLNNALNSASAAADEIATAVNELPGLLNQLEATAARADSVLSAYGDRSAFNAEAVNMLRELRRATESLGSLARMIERNPRAFILGR